MALRNLTAAFRHPRRNSGRWRRRSAVWGIVPSDAGGVPSSEMQLRQL